MSKRKYERIIAYSRVFLTYIIAFLMLNIVIYILKQIWGIGVMNGLLQILMYSSIFSIFIFSEYTYKKMAIRIDDWQSTKNDMKNLMVKMKWNIEDDNENSIVFASRFQWWLWKDKIKVDLTDTEVHISGPNQYVDKLIRLSQFPYAAFDITEKY